MGLKHIRIATRKSPLAVWQAEHVADCIRGHRPEMTVELVGMSTRGDRVLDSPLAKIGGKGLFVKELEEGLLERRADLAVHSMKDVPAAFPPGLHLAAILERDDPCDALVSNHFSRLEELPPEARIGTASLRRQCQLLATRPDLRVSTLRGNVNTRLSKLDKGEFDAIVLAASGLKRLDFASRIARRLTPEECLPAVGQGALGIESRDDDEETNALVALLNHEDTAARVRAERAMTACLQGSCQVPIGAYAELDVDGLYLRGLVGSIDGRTVVRGEIRGLVDDAERLGRLLGDDLLARGGREILSALFENPNGD